MIGWFGGGLACADFSSHLEHHPETVVLVSINPPCLPLPPRCRAQHFQRQSLPTCAFAVLAAASLSPVLAGEYLMVIFPSIIR